MLKFAVVREDPELEIELARSVVRGWLTAEALVHYRTHT